MEHHFTFNMKKLITNYIIHKQFYFPHSYKLKVHFYLIICIFACIPDAPDLIYYSSWKPGSRSTSFLSHRHSHPSLRTSFHTTCTSSHITSFHMISFPYYLIPHLMLNSILFQISCAHCQLSNHIHILPHITGFQYNIYPLLMACLLPTKDYAVIC